MKSSSGSLLQYLARLTKMLILLMVSILSQAKGDESKVVMCHYYTLESEYWPYINTMILSGEDVFPCTHLIYGRNFEIKEKNNNFNLFSDNQVAYDLRALKRMKTKAQSSTKVLVSVKISTVTFNIQQFAEWITTVLRNHVLDGLELDTAHDGFLGDPKLPELLQGLRGTFREDSDKSGKEVLLLTATVHAAAKYFKFYNSKVLRDTLDYVVVNAIRFKPIPTPAGDRDPLSAPIRSHPSPLYRANDVHKTSVDQAMTSWSRRGLESSMMVLPVSTFGLNYIICWAHAIDRYPKTECSWFYGPITDIYGQVAYSQICEARRGTYRNLRSYPKDHPMNQWKNTTVNPYQDYGNDEHVLAKVEYTMYNKFAGVKVYFVHFDDIFNDCGKGNYSLTYLAYRTLTGKTIDRFENGTTRASRHPYTSTATVLRPLWTTACEMLTLSLFFLNLAIEHLPRIIA